MIQKPGQEDTSVPEEDLDSTREVFPGSSAFNMLQMPYNNKSKISSGIKVELPPLQIVKEES